MDSPAAPSSAPHSSWLLRIVVVMLGLQMGLLWLQGRLLHRQHQELVDLRSDVQYLAESLDAALGAEVEEGSYVPMHRLQRGRKGHALVRAAVSSDPPQEPASNPPQDPAIKELEEARASAQKAVKDAREVQSKLSFEENARKAEEKAKLEAAQRKGIRWHYIALGVGVLALIVRVWLRRRG
ncbi:MAG: hypothetical protein LWX11_05680 [Firmicutes bacterium]|nr:hypothetical protein [Bacillota bacterium]